MDGFSPSFFLQLVIAVGSAGAVYGAVRADLANLREKLEEETRLRENAGKETDAAIHDIRNDITGHHGRISKLEGNRGEVRI